MNRVFYFIISLCSIGAFWFFNEYLFAFVFLVPAAFYGFLGLKPAEPDDSKLVVFEEGGMKWTINDFSRGWLGTAKTGWGKTEVIKRMTFSFLRFPMGSGMLAIDQKGDFHEIFSDYTKAAGRAKDLKLVKAGDTELTINLLGDERILARTYAKVLADAASSGQKGGSGDSGNPVFPGTAKSAIEWSIDMFRMLGEMPTPKKIFTVLSDDDLLGSHLMRLDKVDHPKRENVALLLRSKYLDMVSETKDGVWTNINMYLSPYLEPELDMAFFSEQPNFSISDVDNNKYICLSIPQRFQDERTYINNLAKLQFFLHALSRFDLPKKQLKERIPIVCAMDEGDEALSSAESALSEFRAAGRLRAAKATLWLFTQGYSSIRTRYSQEQQKALMLNLTNEIIGAIEDPQDAELAAKRIGEVTRWEQSSRGYSAGKRNATSTKKKVFLIKPEELRKMNDLTGVIRHCKQGFRRTKFKPIMPDGSKPDWYKG